MTEFRLFKLKAEGGRDMGKVPLGVSQLTDNVVIEQSEPDFLLDREALFSKGKQMIILPVSFGSWDKLRFLY